MKSSGSLHATVCKALPSCAACALRQRRPVHPTTGPPKCCWPMRASSPLKCSLSPWWATPPSRRWPKTAWTWWCTWPLATPPRPRRWPAWTACGWSRWSAQAHWPRANPGCAPASWPAPPRRPPCASASRRRRTRTRAWPSTPLPRKSKSARAAATRCRPSTTAHWAASASRLKPCSWARRSWPSAPPAPSPTLCPRPKFSTCPSCSATRPMRAPCSTAPSARRC
jgi:hypothetical protein